MGRRARLARTCASKGGVVRLRVFIVAALVALAVPSATTARPFKPHGQRDAHGARILGTWSVQVTPDGSPSFPALITFTHGGGVIETESDAPGTGQGSWTQISHGRFAFAFQTFIFSSTGAPAGHAVVRSVVRLRHGTLSGPFKFDVFDAAGHKVQSGSGTATATRFAIPQF
jgi:hypothetical protein